MKIFDGSVLIERRILRYQRQNPQATKQEALATISAQLKAEHAGKLWLETLLKLLLELLDSFYDSDQGSGYQGV